MKLNTKFIHGKKNIEDKKGATISPIYQVSSYAYKTAKELEDVFAGKDFGFIYSRINNPTIEEFERKIADIENGVGAVYCSSGMSAITVGILSILKSGDEIVCGGGIFGGTYSLFKNLKNLGIETKYAKDSSIESFEKVINENTKLIFVETIANPKLDIYDIKSLSELAKKNGIILMVDNTAVSPYLMRAIDYGADVLVHSTSKSINGNGTAIGGVIVYSGKFKWDIEKYPLMKDYIKFGSFSYIARIRKELFKDFGVSNAPMNSFLTTIGLETLGLRMERACSNALKIAKLLDEIDGIEVNYPGLEDNEYHNLAKEQFSGMYGYLLTVRFGSKERAFRFIDSLKYAYNLANIGDTRTLVIHPASTIYQSNSIEEKEAMGVYEDLVRISIGIEDYEDLAEDFNNAISK